MSLHHKDQPVNAALFSELLRQRGKKLKFPVDNTGDTHYRPLSLKLFRHRTGLQQASGSQRTVELV